MVIYVRVASFQEVILKEEEKYSGAVDDVHCVTPGIIY